MPALPIQLNISFAAGPQFSEQYQLLDGNENPINLTGQTVEFVIRPTTTDTAEPALVSVSSTGATVQGYITVTLPNIALVVLSPTATALLGQGARPYALYTSPGQPSETAWVAGTCFTSLIAMP